MLKKALAYLLLATAAFLVGRLSVSEPSPEGRETKQVAVSGSVLPQLESLSSKPAAISEAEPPKASTPQSDAFATKVAEMLGAGNLDYHAFSKTVEAWVEADPLGAIDYLARGERREEMLRWIVSIWGREHPELASQWLTENGDMEGLDSAVEGLTQGIGKEDPESALAWAKTIEDPVIKARVYTASGYDQFRHDHDLARASLAESGLPQAAQDAIQESWASSWVASSNRNSQNVSSVVAAASAAGIDFEGSAESIVKQIVKGVMPESGPFKGKFFGTPNLTPLEQAALMDYLRLGESTPLSWHPNEDSE